MSVDEMKWKITSSLNELSEKKLEELFSIIREGKENPPVAILFY